jgi:hypothetical protein
LREIHDLVRRFIIFISVILVVAIGGILIYGLFVTPHFSGLTTMVGDIRAAKEDCVGMAASIKRAQNSGTITDTRLIQQAEDEYRRVSAAFNGCTTILQTGLASRFNKKTAQDLQVRIQAAKTRYRDFQRFYHDLFHPSSVVTAKLDNINIAAFIDKLNNLLRTLTPAGARLYADFMKKNEQEKAELAATLRQNIFPSWAQIPAQ